MKSLRTVTIYGLLALAAAGCTSAFPSPEVEVVTMDPAALTGTNKITITFESKNHIDAIITNNRVVCRGATTQTFNYKVNLYVPADGTDAKLVVEWDATALDALRTAIGYDTNNERNMTFTFSGIDAYGDNHTFTVRDFTIAF